MCQRDIRSTQVTSQQIQTYEAETPLYRSVGKAFLLTPKQSVEEFLGSEHEKLNKTQKDLEGRKEYLERRINNNRSNMADITAGTTAAAM
jgi:chaperonin cofactor prefoldin